MSEKEKNHSNGVMETLSKLEAVKGADYVKGLIDGIGIGTAPAVDTQAAAGE